ncbi:MAG TPA: glycosyltransferase family 39 protein [Thermoanaerobaculia bacterium]
MRAPRARTAAILLLIAFALLCAHGLRWDTPTVDEFAHLPSGYHYLKTGRFDLFPLNPPLVKILCALPLLTLQPEIDTAARVENTDWYPWVFGTDFMERNRGAYDRIFLFGRLPVVALGLLLGWLVFRWARELYGEEAGLVALLFAAFCPSLIAHAHLATVDAGFAAFAVLALWLFWRFVHDPSPGRLAACGVALGLAQLSKFSALLLYPVFILLGAAALVRGERFPLVRGRTRIAWSLASLAAIFLLSLLVIDAGYLFQGVGRTLSQYPFQSRLARTATSFLPAGLPVPLPSAYLTGFDTIQHINDVGEFPEYLFGRWSREGSRAYYLVAILFKTPLPLLAAFLLAPFARFREARGQYFVWLPAFFLLAYFSLFSRVNYGIRYVLPVLPLLMVWAARLVPWVKARGRAVRTAALLLLLAYPLSALLATPDTVSYFNLLARGQGDRILLDSNIDWGQGLKRVRAYMDREGIEEIGLAYFGHVDPAIYGIRWRFPRPDRPGLAAISANFLHGYPYATYAGGRMVPIPPNAFTWIGRHERGADLGGGVFVYRIR